jgi:hypothetical protein
MMHQCAGFTPGAKTRRPRTIGENHSTIEGISHWTVHGIVSETVNLNSVEPDAFSTRPDSDRDESFPLEPKRILKYDDNSTNPSSGYILDGLTGRFIEPFILWQIFTTSSRPAEILLTVKNPGVSVVQVADEAHGTVGA